MSVFVFENIPVEVITVGRRHRRELGDIEALAADIEAHGQLQPIGLTEELELVFGERRLRAMEVLGREKIMARIGPYKNLLEIEISENAQRLPFSPSEMVAIGRHIEKSHADEHGYTTQDGRTGNLPPQEVGRMRDKVAKVFGVSGRTYEKAKQVVEAGEKDEQLSHLTIKMDEAGKVDGAYNELKRATEVKKIRKVKVAKDKVRTLVIDVPWSKDDAAIGSGQLFAHPWMTLDEAADLNPAQWCADDGANVYAWTDTNMVNEAIRIFEMEWGFEFVTLLTWRKKTARRGKGYRTDTEHVIFGTYRKGLPFKVDHLMTSFSGNALKELGYRPAEFYEDVLLALHAPFGEAYGRVAREGFASLTQVEAQGAAA